MADNKFLITCKYCGKQWKESLWYQPKPDEMKCDSCKSTGVMIQPIIDTYAEAKPRHQL